MSIEDRINFVDDVARKDAKRAVKEVERILGEGYHHNQPTKIHPLRDALLILTAFSLFITALNINPTPSSGERGSSRLSYASQFRIGPTLDPTMVVMEAYIRRLR